MKCLKKIFVLLSIIASTAFAVSTVAPTSTYAANNELGSCRYLLGMTSWDCGIVTNPQDEDTMVANIILIATNILTDLTVISTYLVIGYTIYGGYLYIFSSGDASKVMAGKRTLTHAFIGLAIVLSATAILNTIRIAFLGAGGAFTADCAATNTCLDATDFVANALNWFIGVAGAIALVFVFIGGFGYVTSSGDAGKLQKSKSTILYALIGLAIVALALTIVAFVRNIATDANSTSFNSTYIAKELYENQNH